MIHTRPDSWDPNPTTTINVQITSTRMFEAVTGYQAPSIPINVATYERYGLFFFFFLLDIAEGVIQHWGTIFPT